MKDPTPAQGSRGDSLRAAGVVSLCVMASRALGVARNALTAALLGAGPISDALILAWTIPNLFRRVFGEGALSAAFVPVYVEKIESGRAQEGHRLGSIILNLMALALGGAALLGMILCTGFLLAGPGGDSKIGAMAQILAILLPYLPVVCMTAIAGAMLNAFGRFFVPAITQVVVNLAWIAAAALGLWTGLCGDEPLTKASWVAAFTMLAGIFSLAFQFPTLLRRGFRYSLAADWRDPDLRKVAGAFLPAAAGLAVVQVNVFVDRIMAEVFVPGDGAVTHLFYANTLMQLPLGVFAVAVSTAIFPVFSSQALSEKKDRMKETMREVLGMLLFIVLPASLGMAAVAEPLVKLIHERGDFGAASTARTALTLMCYSIGLPFYAASMIITRVFYSLKDTSTPVKISLRVMVANVILNVILIFTPVPLRALRFILPGFPGTEATVPLREAGLALSTSLTGAMGLWLLVRALRGKIGEIGFGKMSRSLGATGLASLVAAVAAFALKESLPVGTSLLEDVQRAVVPVLGGVAAFIFAVGIAKPREYDRLIAAFRRRKKDTLETKGKSGRP